MSNYKEDSSKWAEKWDALFYYFVYQNQKILLKTYGVSQYVFFWEKKSAEQKKQIKKLARQLL